MEVFVLKKAVILLAEGYEEVEAMTPVDLLRRVNVDVQVVSASGEKVVKGSHQIGIETDVVLADVDINNTDLLILPGGMPGTKNLDENEAVRKLVMDFYEKEKYVAAICAAPSVFGHLGILKGRKATCYPGFETELEGAEYVEVPVVKDGHVITSRGVGTAVAFGLKLVEVMTDALVADTIASSIIAK